MSRDRRKSLATLARIKRNDMELVAMQMGDVARKLSALEREHAGLLERMQERGAADSVESARFTADFVRNVTEALRRTEQQSQRIERESAELHAKLVESFAEAKRIDILADRLEADTRAERQRRETALQEELYLATMDRP